MFRTRIDGTVVKADLLSSVFLYIVAYGFVLMLYFIVVLLAGVDVDIAFSGTLSSLGNVGPGTGALGTMGNYSQLPSVVKFIFTFDMFLGRVEIFPLLIVTSMLWNRKNL